ncbi:MAG: hypothetical protein PHV97_07485 [Candidatus Omnitrophica bacterium]|nr:hypothetical protein [Candidatus Omnitrophota bacterium]
MRFLPKSRMFRRCLFPVVFILLVVPAAFAQQEVASEEAGQEASALQAQATMASLFGRGAKMPGIPRINGTIALPAFDNADMKIDEGSLNAAQQQRSE